MSPQIEVAKAVAAMLNGKRIENEVLSVQPIRLLPKYEPSDLNTLRVDVVLGQSASLSRISRGSLSETCPIVIGVQKQCDMTYDEAEYAALLSVLRGIATLVAKTDAGQYGTPSEDVEFRDDAASVDEEGIFRGVVTTAYTVFA